MGPLGDCFLDVGFVVKSMNIVGQAGPDVVPCEILPALQEFGWLSID